MSIVSFSPGEKIKHPELGTGVITEGPREGYLRVFFASGERRVPFESIQKELSRTERILSNVHGSANRLRNVWLSYEAHALPVMESASALTSARIDLLPHQVVLTHRIATASPRRFLVADEVGLGKTIEAALILRELASRGELTRVLVVTPAGLVNNWHRELNDVFNLNFEVFGSEGDITDRKTNAFAKHDRLIASIDTLKRPARINRLLDAPNWDLIIVDEAHHMTAQKTGGKIRKTDNYKLGEALNGHARDMLLLSATPHQGNHFQFWMLIQLLNPALFSSPEDMVENRHRLNEIMFRRTKADACHSDGTSLFARRLVHTESFLMRKDEKEFYEKLRNYLEDGFDLARRKGNKGRTLGFLMAIFQKIVASSFAAVRRTLKRRMLMLTLHEALLRDRVLDIDARDHLYEEARKIIHSEWDLGEDPISRTEVDRIMTDLKYRLAKKLGAEVPEVVSDSYSNELTLSQIDDVASNSVDLHLPEERFRIKSLLAIFPDQRETKVQKLLDGLETLWQENPDEKVIIFTTYLGTVDLLAREIEENFPKQGIVVIRGGDHGAKVAAERRFKMKTGPRVLICTAAGREGINLQSARVLFNFDLPWNPMDLEQRIGRIHRYGQRHTSQVYNLVLSDTIEGRIFLLLNDKLAEIARTLGKVDADGNIAEDLRSQILGQLSENLNYDRLYREALSDPELKRVAIEVETALSNAKEAREVVFDLFQDLDGFSLDDYRPLSDISSNMERLLKFLKASLVDENFHIVKTDENLIEIQNDSGAVKSVLTLDREVALSSDNIELLGLDHPLIQQELKRWKEIPPEEVGAAVNGNGRGPALISIWHVESVNGAGEKGNVILPIAIDLNGTRLPMLEHNLNEIFKGQPTEPLLQQSDRSLLFQQFVEPSLQRELQHKWSFGGIGSHSIELVGYLEVR